MAVNPVSGQPQGYDFKGDPIRVQRQFIADHKALPDWAAPPPLFGASFAGLSQYDALNRLTAATNADGSITRMTYNAANRLETVAINLAGATTNGVHHQHRL